MRRAGRIAVLTCIWVLLWGRLSIANVASGILLSITLLVVYPPPAAAAEGRERFVLRPLPLVHLVAYILVQVVISNIQIATRILTPRSRFSSGVVTFQFHTDSKRMITFISSVLAISPGTMPVEVELEPPSIAVHVLDLDDPEATRRSIRRLEELSIRAFGIPEARVVAP